MSETEAAWRLDKLMIPYPPILFFSKNMAHTVREKKKLLARVRRIRGQIEAIERALDGEDGCTEILHQIAAARGAINGLMMEVIQDHIRMHVANPDIETNAERAKGADELIEVVRTYMK